MNAFSARLKLLRGEMKQAEFARRIGLAQNSYNRYESGERVPDIETLSRMASRLGISSDWLLGLESGKDAAPTTIPPPAKAAKHRESNTEACPLCIEKDKTISHQAESIVNLTRSLAKLAGLKTPSSNAGKARNPETSP